MILKSNCSNFLARMVDSIRNPLSTAVPSFKNSRQCTAQIVDAITGNSVFSVFDHTEHLSKLYHERN